MCHLQALFPSVGRLVSPSGRAINHSISAQLTTFCKWQFRWVTRYRGDQSDGLQGRIQLTRVDPSDQLRRQIQYLYYGIIQRPALVAIVATVAIDHNS